jgi:hypothetical protein
MAHPHDRARVRPKRSRRHSWDADDPGRDRWLHEHVDTAWNSSGPACRRTWAPSPTCHRSSPTPRRSCTAWPLRAVGTGRPPGFVWTIDLDDQPVTKAAWTGWWPSRGRSRPVSGSVDTDPTTEAHRRIGPRPRSRTPRSKPPRSGVGGAPRPAGGAWGPSPRRSEARDRHGARRPAGSERGSNAEPQPRVRAPSRSTAATSTTATPATSRASSTTWSGRWSAETARARPGTHDSGDVGVTSPPSCSSTC